MDKQNKVIGIVGGMGPLAGVALHRSIIRHTCASNDQDHLSVIAMTYPHRMVDRTAYLTGEELESPALGICKVIDQLVQAGAEVIGIPCNTSHAPRIFDQIRDYVAENYHSLTLLSLPNEVAKSVDEQFSENTRIGVMTTNGTYQAGIYQEVLQRAGMNPVLSEVDFQEQVTHRMIYDPKFGIKSHSVEIKPQVLELWGEALRYFGERGVEALLLGCTELSLLPTKHIAEGIVLLDTTDILAKALIREAIQVKFANFI